MQQNASFLNIEIFYCKIKSNLHNTSVFSDDLKSLQSCSKGLESA